MILHLSIDYDENAPQSSYRGVVLSTDRSKEIARWMTGNPQADWASYIQWALEKKPIVLEGSSVTHFVFDCPGWRMVTGDHGHEMLVPERPAEARAKSVEDAGKIT